MLNPIKLVYDQDQPDGRLKFNRYSLKPTGLISSGRWAYTATYKPFSSVMLRPQGQNFGLCLGLASVLC